MLNYQISCWPRALSTINQLLEIHIPKSCYVIEVPRGSASWKSTTIRYIVFQPPAWMYSMVYMTTT